MPSSSTSRPAASTAPSTRRAKAAWSACPRATTGKSTTTKNATTDELRQELHDTWIFFEGGHHEDGFGAALHCGVRFCRPCPDARAVRGAHDAVNTGDDDYGRGGGSRNRIVARVLPRKGQRRRYDQLRAEAAGDLERQVLPPGRRRLRRLDSR